MRSGQRVANCSSSQPEGSGQKRRFVVTKSRGGFGQRFCKVTTSYPKPTCLTAKEGPGSVAQRLRNQKSVVEGKGWSARVDLGGRRINKQNKHHNTPPAKPQ